MKLILYIQSCKQNFLLDNSWTERLIKSFISIWLFFIFSNSLQTSKFSVYPFSSRVLSSSLRSLLLILSWQIAYLHFTQFFFWGFILFLHLEDISLSPHFPQFTVFNFFFLIGWLPFPLGEVVLQEVSSVFQQCSPLWSLELYALGVPCIWTVWVNIHIVMVESPGYMKENMWTFLMQNNNKKKT